jgi:hypothetical protein
VPGVLSDEECYTGESHWDGLLEYPQYTRPEVWRGLAVPPELLCGDHAAVRRWRRKKSLERTLLKRPDMFALFTPREKADELIMSEVLTENGKAPLKYIFTQRRAEPSDIPAILKIIAEAREYLASNDIPQWQGDYPAAGDFLRDIERGECWVFSFAEKIAGTVTIEPRPAAGSTELLCGSWLGDTAACGVFSRFAVCADMRGTALALEMLDFCEELLSGMGKLSARLITHAGNTSMTELMKKRAYSRRGVIKLSSNGGGDPFRTIYEKILG